MINEKIDDMVNAIVLMEQRKEEVIPIIARMYRYEYEELIKVGFHREQAIRILSGTKFL